MKHYEMLTDCNGKIVYQMKKASAELAIEIIQEASRMHTFDMRSLISTALEREGLAVAGATTLERLQNEDPRIQMYAIMNANVSDVAKAYAGTIKAGGAGGKARTKAKIKAVKANGSLGGRPAALTKGLGLVTTGKYMNPATGSVETGSNWEVDYQADMKLSKDERCQNWKLVRVRKPKSADEKEKWGKWMKY